MKNLSFAFIAITFLLLLGCSSEEDNLDTNVDTTSNLITMLNEIVTENSGNNNFIQFDLANITDSNFELINPKQIIRNRHSETYQSYKKGINSTTIRFTTQNRVGLTVCCTHDGENYECSTCADTPGQGICVLEAINACTDNEGCSVVCPSKLVYDPQKEEFVILRK